MFFMSNFGFDPVSTASGQVSAMYPVGTALAYGDSSQFRHDAAHVTTEYNAT